jgi:hypothetical protein
VAGAGAGTMIVREIRRREAVRCYR